MISFKKILTKILVKIKSLDDDKFDKTGGTLTGSIIVDKSSLSSAENASVKVTAAAGNAQAGNSISLLAVQNGNVGLYNSQKEDWDFLHSASTDKTTMPYLGLSSTTSGTVSSTFNNANSKRCHLYKIGKIVFVVIGIHYANATSTIPANTTIFTIPIGYRPSSNVTLSGQFSLPATSTGFNKVVIGSIEVSTAGAVTHTVGTDVYSIYCVGIWETS